MEKLARFLLRRLRCNVSRLVGTLADNWESTTGRSTLSAANSPRLFYPVRQSRPQELVEKQRAMQSSNGHATVPQRAVSWAGEVNPTQMRSVLHLVLTSILTTDSRDRFTVSSNTSRYNLKPIRAIFKIPPIPLTTTPTLPLPISHPAKPLCPNCSCSPFITSSQSTPIRRLLSSRVHSRENSSNPMCDPVNPVERYQR